jgi:pyruvate dehydrogenase E2 component (dihydrolipoamide acetyltransferase)
MVEARKPASESPVSAVSSEIKASPAARKLAIERGIDLAAIKGSGPEGNIVYVDVENFISSNPPSPTPQKKSKPGIDLAAMRTIIAAATTRSKREIPHYYLSHEVDITPTLVWLTQLNAARTPDQRVLPAAVLLRALASATRTHARFNGFYTKDGFQPSEGIHIGVAIAIRGGGLVAPAIHDVDKLSLEELMQKLRDLVERVRAGRFRSSELSDATLTFTGLGDRGVDTVIPVIYPPQVAIAGAGTPRERPWVVAGKVEPRQVITLSLAGDHRASDGHQGALFLAAWAEMLKAPERL